MLRQSIFMLLVAFLATVGYVSAADDFIGEGLFIDGPGGYLPAGDYPAGDTNTNAAFNSNAIFDPAPQVNYNGFMLSMPKIDNNDIWEIMGYWSNLLDARELPFWL